jgi:hypothetical protein
MGRMDVFDQSYKTEEDTAFNRSIRCPLVVVVGMATYDKGRRIEEYCPCLRASVIRDPSIPVIII